LVLFIFGCRLSKQIVPINPKTLWVMSLMTNPINGSKIFKRICSNEKSLNPSKLPFMPPKTLEM
jgi:hypothetical protein